MGADQLQKRSCINASTRGYKITLVSGAGQSDTIGNGLKESIFFKLTYNDDTLSNGFIRFQVYDSDNQHF